MRTFVKGCIICMVSNIHVFPTFTYYYYYIYIIIIITHLCLSQYHKHTWILKWHTHDSRCTHELCLSQYHKAHMNIKMTYPWLTLYSRTLHSWRIAGVCHVYVISLHTSAFRNITKHTWILKWHTHDSRCTHELFTPAFRNITKHTWILETILMTHTCHSPGVKSSWAKANGNASRSTASSSCVGMPLHVRQRLIVCVWVCVREEREREEERVGERVCVGRERKRESVCGEREREGECVCTCVCA